jgi:hypothetical protein
VIRDFIHRDRLRRTEFNDHLMKPKHSDVFRPEALKMLVQFG